MIINYYVSLYNSKFAGYQSKNSRMNNSYVKVFISIIWKYCNDDYWLFVIKLIEIILIERICLEFAFNKIKLKTSRCNSFEINDNKFGCIPEFIVYNILGDIF